MRIRRKTTPAKTGAALLSPPSATKAPTSVHPFQRLQETIGNNAMGQWLRARLSFGKVPSAPGQAVAEGESATAGASLETSLGPGRPLDSSTRSKMETALGADFSGVRVHTDASADQLADKLAGRALTVGDHIAFGSSEYRPGTTAGDALIAHELAHVVQQQSAQDSGISSEPQSHHLEQDANRSAMGAMASLWGRTKGAFSGISQRTGPRLHAGLSLQRCTKSEQFQPPSYLGPHSLRALEEINRIIENLDLLGQVIVYGTAVNIATSSPAETLATGSHDVSPQAQALAGLPSIRKNRINQVIDFLMLEHENELNDEEKRFWQRVREVVNREPQRQQRQEKKQ